MKYRVIKDDRHDHGDYHTYILAELKTDLKGRKVKMTPIVAGDSFLSLIDVVSMMADSFNYDTLSLKDVIAEINTNLDKKGKNNEQE